MPSYGKMSPRSRSGTKARKVINPATGRMVTVGGRAYKAAFGTPRRSPRSPKRTTKKARAPRRKPGPIITEGPFIRGF